MENKILIRLIKKLMYGKLSPSDFFSLRHELRETTDTQLGIYLEEINQNFPPASAMDANVKTDVLNNIYQDLLTRQPKIARRRYAWIFKVASLILLPLTIALSAYIYLSPSLKQQEFIILSNSIENQKTRVLLPDSTEVWLNDDSYLSYSSDFNKDERHVKLKGEAFFEVKHNGSTKFVVETDNLDVIVYGTSFNVSSYQGENQEKVSLVEGKVVLKDKVSNDFLAELKPNTMASFSKRDHTLAILDCDASSEALWIQNSLKFENAHPNEVFYKLERWYNLNIHVENLKTQIFYGFTVKCRLPQIRTTYNSNFSI